MLQQIEQLKNEKKQMGISKKKNNDDLTWTMYGDWWRLIQLC